MNKEAIVYNIVNLYKSKGYTEDEIAEKLEEVRQQVEKEQVDNL